VRRGFSFEQRTGEGAGNTGPPKSVSPAPISNTPLTRLDDTSEIAGGRWFHDDDQRSRLLIRERN